VIDKSDPDQACSDEEPYQLEPDMMEYEAHMIAITLMNFHEKYADEDSHGAFHTAMDGLSKP
jgi:hypothetical protein